MEEQKSRNYFENQVKTATPAQLLLILFDGAIKFAEQAKVKIDENDFEGSHSLLKRVQKIICELIYALDEEIGEEVYKNICALYNFAYLKMVEANIDKEKEAIEEGLGILKSLRDTWATAIEKIQKDKGSTLPDIEETSSGIDTQA